SKALPIPPRAPQVDTLGHARLQSALKKMHPSAGSTSTKTKKFAAKKMPKKRSPKRFNTPKIQKPTKGIGPILGVHPTKRFFNQFKSCMLRGAARSSDVLNQQRLLV